jgi:hypothetical protein
VTCHGVHIITGKLNKKNIRATTTGITLKLGKFKTKNTLQTVKNSENFNPISAVRQADQSVSSIDND